MTPSPNPYRSPGTICTLTLVVSTMILVCTRPGLAVEPVPLTTLSEPSTLRSTPVADLVARAQAIHESATYSDMENLAAAIEQVYVRDRAQAAALTYDELKQLQRFYRAINVGEKDHHAIVAAWLREVPDLRSLTFAQQAWLLGELGTNAPADTVAALKEGVLGQMAPGTIQRLGQRELVSAVRALAPHLEASEKSPLSQMLGEIWASQIASKQAFSLTDAREAAELRAWQDIFAWLEDPEVDPSRYVMYLPDYLAKMTVTELYWRFRYEYVELLAQPIRTEAAQDALLAKATGEANLRQDVLQVLSSSYRQTGRHKAWHRHLDRMIADEGLSDDQRAQWMIAKAYSLGLTDDTHRPTPLAGLALLHEAMELAETDDTRLACLRQIVLGYLGYFKFDGARSEISRWREDFSQPGSEAIQQLETMITMTQHIADQVAAIENQQ
jgi:hypothetical protein